MQKRYMIRVTFKPIGNVIHRRIYATNFDEAFDKAEKQFKTWINAGHHVEIFNPGE